MSTGVALFVFLAGLGCGLLLSLLAMWLAERFINQTFPSSDAQALAGLEVRDSSMGEFDAAVRRSA